MDFRVAVVGFVVGVLIGLTGMGGGAVMTPVLILFGWAKPVVAVGTDLMWAALTKTVGAFVHHRQKTVDYAIVSRLALGSVPGALLGIALLAHLRRAGVEGVDHLVARTLGIALICVALSLLVRSALGLRKEKVREKNAKPKWEGPWWATSVVGLVVGFLVSLTSVGSGSLIVACLVIFYPLAPLRRIVGSDIVHALVLLAVSAAGHLGIGSIDTKLLLALLVGSLPGVWLGSRMSAFFPEKILRPVLGTTLLLLGYKLL